jgi:hypothetical protein
MSELEEITMVDSDTRIERVARALCQADGKKPDDEHQTRETETTRIGAARGPKRIPNWRNYVKAATKFVAAFDVLNKNS